MQYRQCCTPLKQLITFVLWTFVEMSQLIHLPTLEDTCEGTRDNSLVRVMGSMKETNHERDH